MRPRRLYTPGPLGAPLAVHAVQGEFEKLSNALVLMAEEGYRGAVLSGVPDSITLNSTRSRLEGWEYAIQSEGFNGSISPDNGTITVNEPSWVRCIALAGGTQGNNVKEEMTYFELGVNGSYIVLDLFDVATDKTDERAWQFTRSFPLDAGGTLDLWLSASAGLGTFTFSTGTFELEIISSAAQTRQWQS